MSQPLVTVAVPIYNVEKYLERCIRSIVNQTYVNLEIVLIDDGSPDTCPRICDTWAEKDSRIRVVHKMNAGLGMARNTGIEHARGKYIFFFDSDDYIALDTVEKCVAVAEKENADTVLYGFSNVAADGKVIDSFVPDTEKKVYRNAEILEYVLPNLLAPDPQTGKQTNLWMSACGCMFSMELIRNNHWRFISEREIISEDTYSIVCLYKNVRCTAIIPEAMYFYCRNEASLTHTFREDRYARIVSYQKVMMNACQEMGYDNSIIGRLDFVFISFAIAAMKTLVTSDLQFVKKYALLRRIICDDTMQNVIRSTIHDKDCITRKILKWLIRFKLTGICYMLTKIKA